MSFITGRLAASKEAAYFFEESKHAVTRMVEKSPRIKPTQQVTPSSSSSSADILPEILRHSLPIKVTPQKDHIFDPSKDVSSKSIWAIKSSPNNSKFNSNSDALNPLRAFVSLPQVTFGPKRWQIPNAESSNIASTANELRRDHRTPLNPEKLRAAAEGLTQIGKAFAVATALIFGGTSLAFGLVVSKLDIQNSDDFRTKGREIMQPKFPSIKEQLNPLRNWAENMSKKWHLKTEQGVKERPMMKELSRMLGAKGST